MCRQVKCPRCERPTWAGCGAHVEQVLGDVRHADRCQCAVTETAKAASPAGDVEQRSWLSRLLTR